MEFYDLSHTLRIRLLHGRQSKIQSLFKEVTPALLIEKGPFYSLGIEQYS